MQGLVIFKTLDDAHAHGFEFFDIIKDGVLVRKKMPRGWALAIVSEQLAGGEGDPSNAPELVPADGERS